LGEGVESWTNWADMTKNTLNMELLWFPVSKIVEKMVNKAGYK